MHTLPVKIAYGSLGTLGAGVSNSLQVTIPNSRRAHVMKVNVSTIMPATDAQMRVLIQANPTSFVLSQAIPTLTGDKMFEFCLPAGLDFIGSAGADIFITVTALDASLPSIRATVFYQDPPAL